MEKNVNKDNLITIHLDTKSFSSKPSGKVGKTDYIVWRASRNVVNLTKEEFVQHVQKGFTFIPGVCPVEEGKIKGGCKQIDWVQQEIFCLDFDNEGKDIITITLEDTMKKIEEMGLKCFLVYRSFSDGKVINGSVIEKFRIVFATTEVIKERELRDKLQATLMGLMKEHIDKSCKNRNRYFYGTSPDKMVYVDYEAAIDAHEVVDTFWKEEYEEFLPSDAKKKMKRIKTKNQIVESKNKIEKKSQSDDLIPVDEFPDVIPVVYNGLLKYDMQIHCKEYLELTKFVEGKEGTGRRNVVFDAFNVVSLTYGSRKAYEICIEINNHFEEPLSNREFMNNIMGAFEHIEEVCSELHESQYVYRYDTLIERLNIDENIVEELDYFKNKRAKEHADVFRELKNERNEFICELYKEGKSSREIAKELERRHGKNSELAISDRSIRKYIEKNISKVGTFGTTTLFNNILINPNASIEEFSEEKICEDNADNMDGLNTYGQESAKSKLNERQQKALEDALNGSNILITGGAGVGKSFLVHQIIDELRKQGKKVGICAASALAASSYDDGMTFHRMFGYSETETIYLDVIDRLFYLDVIVIEEVGMLGKKQMDFLGKLLDYLEENFLKRIQIIMVGDFMQLPPIKDEYCFESAYFKRLNLKTHYLIENIRQKGSEALFNALNDIRLYQDASKEINRICSKYEDFNSIYLVPKRDMAKDKNNECLKRLEGELIDLGNDQFIKIGAKIICTRNAYVNGKLKYYNGLQGKVIKVSKGKNIITIKDMKDNIFRISRVNMEENEKEIKKFPIELGYAITIHKSQGMTLDSANIEPKVFAPGQLYVALSRVKTAEGIHLLHPVRSKDIKCNEYSKRALDFDEALRRQCEWVFAVSAS